MFVDRLAIERTPDASATPIEHMRVDHGGLYVFVPQEFLHCANIVAV